MDVLQNVILNFDLGVLAIFFLCFTLFSFNVLYLFSLFAVVHFSLQLWLTKSGCSWFLASVNILSLFKLKRDLIEEWLYILSNDLKHKFDYGCCYLLCKYLKIRKNTSWGKSTLHIDAITLFALNIQTLKWLWNGWCNDQLHQLVCTLIIFCFHCKLKKKYCLFANDFLCVFPVGSLGQ